MDWAGAPAVRETPETAAHSASALPEVGAAGVVVTGPALREVGVAAEEAQSPVETEAVVVVEEEE
ncbi:MAG: hypothetical protein ACR2PK_02755, partial [Acidimicrobiales bacterium]